MIAQVGKYAKYLAIVAMFASFGVWGYIFSGAADREPPDLLSDKVWTAEAEALCLDAVADVAELPSAQNAADPAERSSQIRASTSRFQTMVDEIRQLSPEGERDTQITTAWLDDWQVLIDDRFRYADRIVQDPDQPFTITDTGVSERLDKRITRFANTNEMYSCVSPTDV